VPNSRAQFEGYGRAYFLGRSAGQAAGALTSSPGANKTTPCTGRISATDRDPDSERLVKDAKSMRKFFQSESSKYGGATDNLDTFARAFQLARDNYGITPEEILRVTHLMLKGPALDYYLSHVKLAVDSSSVVPAFDQAMKVISDKFLSPAARTLELKQLQSLHVSTTISRAVPTYQQAVQVLAE
jgi:hypothetical protein